VVRGGGGAMTPASSFIRAAPAEQCLPWPRHVLAHEDWGRMAAALADEPTLALLALWADTGQVHALLRDEPTGEPLLASTAIEAGSYPALSPGRPLGAWFERMVQDLWGHTALGGTDLRPWLDHGHWPHTAPMALRPGAARGAPEPPEFLRIADGELDQIPLGPVHGGIEPPSHLRLTGRGESIVTLEARLGYTHKASLTLMRGKSPRAAARFAARLSGEATVAHAIAFARATEAASQCEVPPRAVVLRAVMAELERIAGHLGDLGAVAATAGFGHPAARCSWHGEAIRRAVNLAFGHRLMMDCVIPGGVAGDSAPGAIEAIKPALGALAIELPELRRSFARAPLAAQLSGVALVTAEPVMRYAAGGVIGRASGRDNDLRRSPGYPPYPELELAMPLLSEGDAAARASVRLNEIAQSIRLLQTLSDRMPDGPVSAPLQPVSGEGIGFAEGPRGDIWHWLRLDHGQIASVFMRDPAWAHWPILEAVMAGGLAEDLPLVQASLGLSSSGVDL
jgi:Ni,Fe-hydrogenase III large subunit